MVKERSVGLHEIITHINRHGTCIVLTNANLLSCETCNYFDLCGRATNCSIGAASCLPRYCNDSYQVGKLLQASVAVWQEGVTFGKNNSVKLPTRSTSYKLVIYDFFRSTSILPNGFYYIP